MARPRLPLLFFFFKQAFKANSSDDIISIFKLLFSCYLALDQLRNELCPHCINNCLGVPKVIPHLKGRRSSGAEGPQGLGICTNKMGGHGGVRYSHEFDSSAITDAPCRECTYGQIKYLLQSVFENRKKDHSNTFVQIFLCI